MTESQMALEIVEEMLKNGMTAEQAHAKAMKYKEKYGSWISPAGLLAMVAEHLAWRIRNLSK